MLLFDCAGSRPCSNTLTGILEQRPRHATNSPSVIQTVSKTTIRPGDTSTATQAGSSPQSQHQLIPWMKRNDTNKNGNNSIDLKIDNKSLGDTFPSRLKEKNEPHVFLTSDYTDWIVQDRQQLAHVGRSPDRLQHATKIQCLARKQELRARTDSTPTRVNGQRLFEYEGITSKK
jgi:hypothetical protein